VECSAELCLSVNLRRLNRPGREGTKVHAPKFPKPKDEGWFLVLGTVEDRELCALKRVGPVRGRSTQQLSFAVPETVGKVIYTLYVMSDSYLGLDQQYDICVDVGGTGEVEDEVFDGNVVESEGNNVVTLEEDGYDEIHDERHKVENNQGGVEVASSSASMEARGYTSRNGRGGGRNVGAGHNDRNNWNEESGHDEGRGYPSRNGRGGNQSNRGNNWNEESGYGGEGRGYPSRNGRGGNQSNRGNGRRYDGEGQGNHRENHGGDVHRYGRDNRDGQHREQNEDRNNYGRENRGQNGEYVEQISDLTKIIAPWRSQHGKNDWDGQEPLKKHGGGNGGQEQGGGKRWEKSGGGNQGGARRKEGNRSKKKGQGEGSAPRE